jgi:hypothetical protein
MLGLSYRRICFSTGLSPGLVDRLHLMNRCFNQDDLVTQLGIIEPYRGEPVRDRGAPRPSRSLDCRVPILAGGP